MRKLPLLLGLSVVTASGAASAFERQWHLGADGGWAAVSHRGTIYSGFGGGVHGMYGLTDSYNLMLDLAGTSHSVGSGLPQLAVLSGAAGVSYTLDVLRWVPYMGLLVGAYRFSGADLNKPELKLGFQVVLGLDYAINRSWGIGLQLKYHTFSDDPFSAHYLTTFLRAEYRFGW